MVLNALTTLSLSLLKVMGCSSVSDAHIYMHHVSSVRDWWKKNELGCSWDVQDAQDALKTDPLVLSISKLTVPSGEKSIFQNWNSSSKKPKFIPRVLLNPIYTQRMSTL